MRSRALRVPRVEGETARRLLLVRDALRRDLVVVRDGSSVTFPIRDDAAVPPGLGEEGVHEFPSRTTAAPSDYRGWLPWTEEQKQRLPRSFDVVGDIVLVRLGGEWEGRAPEIGAALLRFVPGARIVGWDRGVQGTARIRAIERIAGTGGWETRHHENGLTLFVDVERAYFSPRLAREHARVASEVEDGETVLDLACGVGPFALTIARDGRARSIEAVDANPAAVELLGRSLSRLPQPTRVVPRCATIEAFVGEERRTDRAILNLPREGIKYAPSVARLVEPGGRLHHYEVVPRAESQGRAKLIESALLPAGEWVAEETHVVHPYSPSSDLLGFRFRRRASGG